MTLRSKTVLMCSACSLALSANSQAQAQAIDSASAASSTAVSPSDQAEARTASAADPQTATVQSGTIDDPGTGTGCFYEPPRTYGVTVGFRF